MPLIPKQGTVQKRAKAITPVSTHQGRINILVGILVKTGKSGVGYLNWK